MKLRLFWTFAKNGGNYMIQPRELRPRLIATLAATILALTVCAHAGSKVTTSLSTALTGSFFLDTGDQSSSEWIDFSGDVHLVVQAIPPDPIIPPTPIRVHINMAGVSGIGRTSGTHYALNGSENFEADGAVPNTLSLQGEYRLIPPNPIIPPTPVVPINFTVQVNESAVATGATAALGECTKDVCDQ